MIAADLGENVVRIETLRPTAAARLAVVTADTLLRSAAAALSNPQIGLLVVCDENRRAIRVPHEREGQRLRLHRVWEEMSGSGLPATAI